MLNFKYFVVLIGIFSVFCEGEVLAHRRQLPDSPTNQQRRTTTVRIPIQAGATERAVRRKTAQLPASSTRQTKPNQSSPLVVRNTPRNQRSVTPRQTTVLKRNVSEPRRPVVVNRERVPTIRQASTNRPQYQPRRHVRVVSPRTQVRPVSPRSRVRPTPPRREVRLVSPRGRVRPVSPRTTPLSNQQSSLPISYLRAIARRPAAASSPHPQSPTTISRRYSFKFGDLPQEFKDELREVHRENNKPIPTDNQIYEENDVNFTELFKIFIERYGLEKPSLQCVVTQ